MTLAKKHRIISVHKYSMILDYSIYFINVILALEFLKNVSVRNPDFLFNVILALFWIKKNTKKIFKFKN